MCLHYYSCKCLSGCSKFYCKSSLCAQQSRIQTQLHRSIRTPTNMEPTLGQCCFCSARDGCQRKLRASHLGCKFRSRFRSLMGRNSVGTQKEAQSSGGAVSVSVIFSSTWRHLNLNFLDIGFSLRCKGSKTIDKPSPNVLGLLCSGGGGVQIGQCVKVRQWKTVRAAKPQLEHSGWKNSGIRYGTETPIGLSREFAT
jgi:hypothetical protein